MNVRNFVKTAAVALPMAFAPMKGAAQSAAKVAENAQRIVAEDTIKAANTSGLQDARTVVLKKWNGHFDGSVKNGRIGDGNLVYNEKAKTLLPEKKGKVDINIDANYIHGDELVNNGGFGLHGSAQAGNNLYDVAGLVAHKDPLTDFVAKASYTRLFPLGSGFAATAKGEAEGVIHRVKTGDSWGAAYGSVKAGAKYEHKFDNGMRVAAKAEAGPAFGFTEKEDRFHDFQKVRFVADGELEAGMNKVSLFVKGGKDAVCGNNIGGGIRVNL